MGRKKLNRVETPEERFKRVAEYRTRVVLDKLRLLGNCSNRHIYKYSEKDIDKIFLAVNSRIKDIRNKFENRATTSDSFKL
jgi:hypothetical protein